MTTLDELNTRAREQLHERSLDLRIETFSKLFRPDDPKMAYEFDVGLHSIVRAVYREAQEPLLKQVNAIMSLSLTPFVATPVKEPKEGS